MELYHILNRGVDKRDIFIDGRDYARFVHDLYEFNDTAPASPLKQQKLDLRSPTFRRVVREPEPRERVVNVHGWCLMRNHYHLLLTERVEGGLTQFIRKLNIGYAKYFNEKYKRDGALFQGRTKKVLVRSDPHFLYILHYIHLNPLDYLRGSEEWRQRRVQSPTRALTYLEGYRWSSYRDYCGEKNFPSILTTDLFGDVFGNYKKELTFFLKTLGLEPLHLLTLK